MTPKRPEIGLPKVKKSKIRLKIPVSIITNQKNKQPEYNDESHDIGQGGGCQVTIIEYILLFDKESLRHTYHWKSPTTS